MGKTGQRPLTVTELCGELGRDEKFTILLIQLYAKVTILLTHGKRDLTAFFR
jgi:hypothetical protein